MPPRLFLNKVVFSDTEVLKSSFSIQGFFVFTHESESIMLNRLLRIVAVALLVISSPPAGTTEIPNGEIEGKIWRLLDDNKSVHVSLPEADFSRARRRLRSAGRGSHRHPDCDERSRRSLRSARLRENSSGATGLQGRLDRGAIQSTTSIGTSPACA